MSTMRIKSLPDRRQAGLASIIITMVMMIIVTFIVLGFSQVARHNQRQALDRQLSSQAFYAAETGVNRVQSQLAKQNLPSNNQICAGSETALSADGTNVINTCLLTDVHPITLKYDIIPDKSQVIPIIDEQSPAGPSTVKIDWHVKGAPPVGDISSCPGGNSFTAKTSAGTAWNCDYDVIRFDLVKILKKNNFTLDDLEQNTVSVFLHPNTSLSVIRDSNYLPAITVSGTCDSSSPLKGCSATINNLNLQTNDYYLRMISIYKTNKVTISAQNGGVSQPLSKAQVLVDSTGRANDVLRRIQVRLPLQGANIYPDYAVQSAGSICKQFQTGPGITNNNACSTTPCTSCTTQGITHYASYAEQGDQRPCVQTHDCVPPEGYHFEAVLVNNTNDTTNTPIDHCIWYWDDNKPLERLGPNDPGCKPNTQKTHVFAIQPSQNPLTAYPTGNPYTNSICKTYHPTLTVYYADNTQPVVFPSPNDSQAGLKRPYGNINGKYCPG